MRSGVILYGLTQHRPEAAEKQAQTLRARTYSTVIRSVSAGLLWLIRSTHTEMSLKNNEKEARTRANVQNGSDEAAEKVERVSKRERERLKRPAAFCSGHLASPLSFVCKRCSAERNGGSSSPEEHPHGAHQHAKYKYGQWRYSFLLARGSANLSKGEWRAGQRVSIPIFRFFFKTFFPEKGSRHREMHVARATSTPPAFL